MTGLTGLRWLSFLLGAYWAAVRYAIPPVEYRLYHLDQPEGDSLREDYIYWFDVGPLMCALNRRAGAELRLVNDKHAFFVHCRAHRLPVVETLLHRQQSSKVAMLWTFNHAEEIWLKPVHGRGGEGAECWSRDDMQGFVSSSGMRLDPQAFSAHLNELSRRRAYLLQPRLNNHPDLEALTNGGLASLRLVTGRSADGEVHHIASLLHLPYGENLAANGALLCRVRWPEGSLSDGYLAATERMVKHPHSSIRFDEQRLPHAHECLALALGAHAHFPGFVFLGWDIAITPDGPILLEANSGWLALHHQLLDSRPLGQGPFMSVLMSHL